MAEGNNKNLTISAVFIVKNEMEFLGRAIKSVLDADEVIVVDTGSTDNGETCRIARSFGPKVKVYENEYKWADSFAAARNFAKSKATCAWVISTDADEYIHDFSAVREAVAFAEANGIRSVDVLQHAEDATAQTNVFPRLFRNDPDIVWHGAAHNYHTQLGIMLVKDNGVIRACKDHSEAEKAKALVHLTFGYSLAHLSDKDRTLRILEKAVLENSPDAGAREKFYLAREYYYRQQWDKCAAMMERYLQESRFPAEKAEGFLILSHCYWNSGKGEQARLACLNALLVNPHFKEAAFLMSKLTWPHHGAPWRAMARAADDRDVLFRRTVVIPDEPPAQST